MFITGQNTQEVIRNTWLRVIFPPTLLSCSSRFQRALQQNKAKSRLFYFLILLFQAHVTLVCLAWIQQCYKVISTTVNRPDQFHALKLKDGTFTLYLNIDVSSRLVFDFQRTDNKTTRFNFCSLLVKVWFRSRKSQRNSTYKRKIC